MELCHRNSVLRSLAIQQLGQFVQDWHAHQTNSLPDFEQFERELHEHVMAVEREILKEELARYDVTAEQIEVDGVAHRYTLTSSETYMPSAGPITVTRRLYRPAGRGSRSICPLELQAGIVRGYWTPRAARQAAFVMAHLTQATVKPCSISWAGCDLRGPAWIGCRKSCPPTGRPIGTSGKPYCVPRRSFPAKQR
jgi:hypothetical protein